MNLSILGGFAPFDVVQSQLSDTRNLAFVAGAVG